MYMCTMYMCIHQILNKQNLMEGSFGDHCACVVRTVFSCYILR